MSAFDGFLISVAAFAGTAVFVALAGVVIVALQISDERCGSGCRGAGCRRDAGRTGGAGKRARPAEPDRDAISRVFLETGWADIHTARRFES